MRTTAGTEGPGYLSSPGWARCCRTRPSPGLPGPTALCRGELCPPEMRQNQPHTLGQASQPRGAARWLPASQGQQPRCPSTGPGDEQRASPSSSGATRGAQDPLPSREPREVPQRQRAGASVGQKRAAVATCDVQCPSRALAATAALDARGDAGAMRREPTKSRPAAAGRNGSPGAAGARGERTSSNAAGRVLALASALWHCGTAEHDANGYH